MGKRPPVLIGASSLLRAATARHQNTTDWIVPRLEPRSALPKGARTRRGRLTAIYQYYTYGYNCVSRTPGTETQRLVILSYMQFAGEDRPRR
jgi:hypothetical protein